MRLIETTQKYVTDDEVSAKDLIEKFRAESAQKGYSIKKASYSRKDKKSKGEIIATVFVVEIVQSFGSLWEEV